METLVLYRILIFSTSINSLRNFDFLDDKSTQDMRAGAGFFYFLIRDEMTFIF